MPFAGASLFLIKEFLKSKYTDMKKLIFVLSMLLPLCVFAQSREFRLSISVTTDTEQSLAGTSFSLKFGSISYPSTETVLDADGKCSIKVYKGTHTILIEKDGYAPYTDTFDMDADKGLNIKLTEEVRNPFALTTSLSHDAYTGKNDVVLSWNREKPAFFDDFESYEDWSVGGSTSSFGDWTGIDGDQEAAAPLAGEYQNRGALQYAQIINPLTVEPAWWYQYPVLRSYSGKQYVGFIRTSSGMPNDDWLISPEITVGTDNVVSFMAKAGDRYKERFEVGITTVTDNPTALDFNIISNGNYEQVSYEDWQKMEYDLSEYAGEKVKIAIHYISEANNYGAFMLMVDDFFVGQTDYEQQVAQRVGQMRSPANPNEKFIIYKNGENVGETEEYTYAFKDLTEGEYEFGVQAKYLSAVSDITKIKYTVDNSNYVKVSFEVSANDGSTVDGLTLNLLDKMTTAEYSVKVAGGKASIASLPKGEYTVTATSDNYEEYKDDFTLDAEKMVTVELKEKIVDPFNITADVKEGENGLYNVSVKWNQNLGFSDSFETYDDFAVGSFGDWKTLDLDQMPVYPIALGDMTNIVSFPGSGTQASPKAIAPMVFNPYKTTPAMAPTDPAIMAPDGDKTVVFFSPQTVQADKWLISPAQKINEGYVWRLTAKGYSIYPEIIQFCISTTDDQPESFTSIDQVTLSYDGWNEYTLDLSQYAGQTIYLGVHYISTDAFLAQVDEFYVGPKEEGAAANVGNVQKYEVSLDGTKLQEEPVKPEITLTGVAEGEHTLGLKAVYKSGLSQLVEYKFVAGNGGVDSAVAENAVVIGSKGCISIDTAIGGNVEVFNAAGQAVASIAVAAGHSEYALSAGIYVVKAFGNVQKVAVK